MLVTMQGMQILTNNIEGVACKVWRCGSPVLISESALWGSPLNVMAGTVAIVADRSPKCTIVLQRWHRYLGKFAEGLSSFTWRSITRRGQDCDAIYHPPQATKIVTVDNQDCNIAAFPAMHGWSMWTRRYQRKYCVLSSDCM